MRDSSQRAGKYGRKLSGSTAKAVTDIQRSSQASRFRNVIAGQVEAERYVKTLDVPAMFQLYYMAFAKGIIKIRAKYTGTEAQNEVCILEGVWESRGLDAGTLNGIAEHYGFNSCEGPAPPACDWTWKRKLTFSGNVSATDLDDFPVLVHLTSLNFDFTHAQANGEDVRFMNSDTCPADGTPLKHEIENWDQAGQEAWVWVKVPRIDGGSVADFIYMYYGNAAVPDGQDPANVWTSSYRVVHHMKDDPDNATITDSTSNAYAGVKKGANEPAQADCQVYKGQDFDGTDDRINSGHGTGWAHTGSWTISIWFKNDTSVDWDELFGCASSGSNPNDQLNLGWDRTNNQFRAYLIANNKFQYFTFPDASANYNGWNHIVWIHTGLTSAGHTVYLNGSPVVLNHVWTDNFGGSDTLTRNIYLACQWYGSYTRFWPGKEDEYRVADTNRSGDWAAVQYIAQNDALITYGAEEAG